MKNRISKAFLKAIIRLLGCCREDYLKMVSMGGDVYVIKIYRFISPQDELKEWMGIIGEDALAGTRASD